jgi:hypothetical protein
MTVDEMRSTLVQEEGEKVTYPSSAGAEAKATGP